MSSSAVDPKKTFVLEKRAKLIELDGEITKIEKDIKKARENNDNEARKTLNNLLKEKEAAMEEVRKSCYKSE